MKPPLIDLGSFLVRFSYVHEVAVARCMCGQFFEVPEWFRALNHLEAGRAAPARRPQPALRPLGTGGFRPLLQRDASVHRQRHRATYFRCRVGAPDRRGLPSHRAASGRLRDRRPTVRRLSVLDRRGAAWLRRPCGSEAAPRWVACHAGFFVPVRVLSQLSRRLFRRDLKNPFAAGYASLSISLASLAPAPSAHVSPNCVTFDWVAYAKPPFGGAR